MGRREGTLFFEGGSYHIASGLTYIATLYLYSILPTFLRRTFSLARIPRHFQR